MKNVLLSLVFLSAVALAGSEGEWFPWPNLAGAALFVIFTALAGRYDARRDP